MHSLGWQVSIQGLTIVADTCRAGMVAYLSPISDRILINLWYNASPVSEGEAVLKPNLSLSLTLELAPNISELRITWNSSPAFWLPTEPLDSTRSCWSMLWIHMRVSGPFWYMAWPFSTSENSLLLVVRRARAKLCLWASGICFPSRGMHFKLANPIPSFLVQQMILAYYWVIALYFLLMA